jgi:hypothetical protein
MMDDEADDEADRQTDRQTGTHVTGEFRCILFYWKHVSLKA